MASKKHEKPSTKSKAAKPKKTAVKAVVKAKKAERPAVKAGPRHPRGRVREKFTSKAALAKSLAAVVARSDEDTDQIEARLKTASNQQLLRLQRVSETVKQKYGNREKLIAAIGTAEKKSTDKDYLAKLDSFSLPQLLDLAVSAERRARA